MRYGLPTAQLKQFIDTTGPLWGAGKLADKVATILALNNIYPHWGAVIVPPGYTDKELFAAGGNPYGASFGSGDGTGGLSEEAKRACHIQGKRLARFAAGPANVQDVA